MATKIDVEYGRGKDTPLFSITENKFYLYGQESNVLHTRYGGKQYYESRSGKSGAGFFQPTIGENDLIVFGHYRTDVSSVHEQRCRIVWQFVQHMDLEPIFGYAPLDYHGGKIDQKRPFILSDGQTVVFLQDNEILETLKNWKKILDNEENQLTTINITVYHPRTGAPEKVSYYLYNPHGFCGVNALRFVDLRRFRPTDNDRANYPSDNRISVRRMILTKIINIELNDDLERIEVPLWLFTDKLGYFNTRLDVDPLKIRGEIGDGWCGDGHGLIWKQGRYYVSTILEMRRRVLSRVVGATMTFPGASEWVEYEEDISVLDWYTMKSGERYQHMLQKLVEKTRKEAFLHFADEKYSQTFQNLLQEHREFIITIQDSLDSGNCWPGTNQFLEEYNLPNEISLGALLDHKQWLEMIKYWSFRKVLVSVLQKKGVAIPEKEIE